MHRATDEELFERLKLLRPENSVADCVCTTDETLALDVNIVTVQAAFLRLHECSKESLAQCREGDLVVMKVFDTECRESVRVGEQLQWLWRLDEECGRRALLDLEEIERQHLTQFSYHELWFEGKL